jgi:membrane protein YdbS with pleckstrin-like domain
MDNSVQASTGSWPIATILTIVFVVLKLVGTIDWSWWWIFSPLWISAAFGAFIFFVFIVVWIFAYIFSRD